MEKIKKELKKRSIKTSIVFIASFIFFFMFTIKFTTVQIPHMSEHIIPYIACSYKESLSVQLFQNIRTFLIPDFVKPMVTHPTGGIGMILQSSMILSAFITIPFAIYQGIQFISPALSKNESKMVRNTMIPGTLLFFSGALFCFYYFLPKAYFFLYRWSTFLGVQTKLTLTNFMSFTSSMMIMMGLAWELPLVMASLSRIGLVKSSTWTKYKKHVLVGLAALAGMITPADIFTWCLFFVPLLSLYFVGVYLSEWLEEGGEN